MNENMSVPEDVFAYAAEKYGVQPEYPWVRYPEYAALRHRDNQKMFALIGRIEKSRLGLSGPESVDILNVKLNDPLLVDLLSAQEGYLRGYHIRGGNWITVLLDGTVPLEDICRWLDVSFLTTASSATRKKLRSPKEWIIPANPKYYDIVGAFAERREILWKQGKGIKKGDTVFMYVASPVSAVLFQCLVTETDIPSLFKKTEVPIKSLMKVRLIRRFPPDAFSFDRLGAEFDIFAVRGPRGIPKKLSDAFRSFPL